MRFQAFSVLLALTAAPSSGAQSSGTTPSRLQAVRSTRPPVLDGRDSDEVWDRAPRVDAFREFEPAEDKAPSYRSEVRVAYDDRALFVFVRAFDPNPDSIVGLLSRRDVKTTSDQLKIMIDAYHDRRTGVMMAVNPVGVKRDAAFYQDQTEDATWDGVWDVATLVDSLGWTAEFRVPFSQLRFGSGEAPVFGFAVWRDIARRNERVGWPVYRPSRQGIPSQWGTLEGLHNIGRSPRLELLPYVLSKNVTEPRDSTWRHPQQSSVGLDLKLGLTDHLTIDATMNPDFGQVEADPSVLNLTAFEIRFDERRPFFQEGVGLYKCQPCQGLFYSRRIGRSPQLRASPLDPAATTILAATKLTGRFAGGLNLGVVEAVTQREVGVNHTTIEPQTNYLVLRAVQELRRGRSSLGGIVTALNRQLDPATAPLLRRSAYTGVVEGFHRFASDRYEVQLYAGLNRVEGSRQAIALTQLGPVHLYQRPDDDLRYDSTRTAMEGKAIAFTFSRLAGAFRYSTYLRHAGAGMELNDMGLVPLVNDRQVRNTFSLRSLRPRAFYRQSFSQVETENHWTVAGLPNGTSISAHTSFAFLNSWGAALTWKVLNYGTNYCIACARGGPALRQSPRQRLQLNINGDARDVFVPKVEVFTERGDGGRTNAKSFGTSFDLRVASRFSMSLGLNGERRIEDQQWVQNVGNALSDTTHFTFARLRLTTASLTARASWTATPTLSLQLYAQPFVSSGSFTDWRELRQPRARAYADRFRPWGNGAVPTGLNVKQFNSNLVARWEYRPGSTLFLVWQQGREQAGVNPGTFEFVRDYRDLFAAHPMNTILVKVAYWLSP